nr:hypothetical protein [Anaerolineae bacterium]NIN95810.1 hypothetical protein [Anaerolineae bacterium]NIQ78776.1 hypothetical protein [Anaerolineae bacterium]
TLVKTVVNDDGGTAVAADFQAYIDAGAVNWSTAYDLSAGSYTASEDVVSGYSASVWSGDCASDGSVTLGLDEDAICYITNDDLPICIEIEKTGEECAHPGEEITYDFWVHNCGEVTLNGVTVTDPLWDPDLNFPLGSLQPDEEAEFDRSYTVPSVFSGDLMPNTATVQGTDVLGRAVSDSDGHVVEILHPCIEVTKKHLPSKRADGQFFPGDKVTYVFKVKNCSADTPLYNVKVVDEWLRPYSGQRFSKNLGSLGAGSNKGFSWVYTIPTDAEAGLDLVNKVTAFGVDDCGGTVDDTDRDPLPVGQPRVFVPEWDSILLLASGLGPLAAYASMRLRKRR